MTMVCGVGGKGLRIWRAFFGAVQSLSEYTTTLPATAMITNTTKIPSRFGLNLELGLRSASLSDTMVRGFACGAFRSRANFRTLLRDFQPRSRRLGQSSARRGRPDIRR